MIVRGNHKSALEPKEHVEALFKNYKKEVESGCMLPVTVENLRKIKGAGVILVGLAPQFTVDDDGNRIKKCRTTHDT